MKTTYLELLKKIDTSIFQNYKIVDDEEIDIDESQELYDLLSKIGIGDEYWKDWLNQSWGSPEYHQIWDGEELFEGDFFDTIEDAKEYRSVWTIKGAIEIELDCFENE